MPQITIYLPRDVAERVKKKAKSLRKSLSAYITELLRQNARPSKWPKEFVNLYGSTKGELLPIHDLKFEDREKL